MSRPEPQNLFELEGIEQRILLSGDPLLGALYISAPDELDPAVDIGIEPLPVEESLVSGEDTPQDHNPFRPPRNTTPQTVWMTLLPACLMKMSNQTKSISAKIKVRSVLSL